MFIFCCFFSYAFDRHSNRQRWHLLVAAWRRLEMMVAGQRLAQVGVAANYRPATGLQCMLTGQQATQQAGCSRRHFCVGLRV